jgi:hypothetical protein
MKLNDQFIGGFVFYMGLYSAFQDYYGLDRYIEFCIEGWVDTDPIWSILIAFMGLWYASIWPFDGRKQNENPEKQTRTKT